LIHYRASNNSVARTDTAAASVLYGTFQAGLGKFVPVSQKTRQKFCMLQFRQARTNFDNF